jgi:hypothetical protein
MTDLERIVSACSEEVARAADAFGASVDVQRRDVLDRRRDLRLGAPSHVSPNGACRLIRAEDGWIAVNLAREDDIDLLPAWLACQVTDPWASIEGNARRRSCADLVSGAVLLGLPVSAAGEVTATKIEQPRRLLGKPKTPAERIGLVVDLSALWAGPLCAAILQWSGAVVVKYESVSRPDPSRWSTPDLYRRLNGGKRTQTIDLSDRRDLELLHAEIAKADVLVTSARPRALDALGLTPTALFQANPALVWVAVTGYGSIGHDSNRVAFGDDAAAAGGLLDWSNPEAPRFLGDALADPITGLAAAAGALRALRRGGGVLIDASLARTAAAAAVMSGARAH